MRQLSVQRSRVAGMSMVERLHWLTLADHPALITHALYGDQLSPPEPQVEWFAATRVSRSERVLMLCYETARAMMALCVVAPATLSVAKVERWRTQASPLSAEAKWGPLVGHIGRYQRLASADAREGWQHWNVPSGASGVWRVRRARHPCALIDRLLVRDRMELDEQMRAAFCDCVEGDVGEAPLHASGVNMGDKRAE